MLSLLLFLLTILCAFFLSLIKIIKIFNFSTSMKKSFFLKKIKTRVLHSFHNLNELVSLKSINYVAKKMSLNVPYR